MWQGWRHSGPGPLLRWGGRAAGTDQRSRGKDCVCTRSPGTGGGRGLTRMLALGTLITSTDSRVHSAPDTPRPCAPCTAAPTAAVPGRRPLSTPLPTAAVLSGRGDAPALGHGRPAPSQGEPRPLPAPQTPPHPCRPSTSGGVIPGPPTPTRTTQLGLVLGACRGPHTPTCTHTTQLLPCHQLVKGPRNPAPGCWPYGGPRAALCWGHPTTPLASAACSHHSPLAPQPHPLQPVAHAGRHMCTYTWPWV